MRLLGAALFVIIGAFGLTSIFVNSVDKVPHALQILVMFVAFPVLIVLAMIVFGEKRQFQSSDKYMAELEEKGLIEETHFSATRTFAIAEWEGLGLNYFLELQNGEVLFLRGQYFYDYDAIIDDEPEFSQPRTFPCRDFTIRRHRTEKHVLKIICRGAVLEPEGVAPSWSRDDFRRNRIPTDGTIFQKQTYDEIKAEHL